MAQSKDATTHENMYASNGVGSGSTTQVSQSRQQKTTPRERRKGALRGLGLAEVVIGSLSVVLCFVTLILARTVYIDDAWIFDTRYLEFGHVFTWTSQGIWCGAFAIVSGILGIKAKNNPSVRMYNANLTMSIVAAFIMALLIITSSAAAVFAVDDVPGLVAVHTSLSLLAFAGMVICIVHSAFCCAGVCCHKRPYQGGVAYVPEPVHHGQKMVQPANGQYVMAPAQAMAVQNPTAPVPVAGGNVVFQVQQCIVDPANVVTLQSCLA